MNSPIRGRKDFAYFIPLIYVIFFFGTVWILLMASESHYPVQRIVHLVLKIIMAGLTIALIATYIRRRYVDWMTNIVWIVYSLLGVILCLLYVDSFETTPFIQWCVSATLLAVIYIAGVFGVRWLFVQFQKEEEASDQSQRIS